MKYNIIGIDPSIISTGMVINSKVFNYCRADSAVLKSGKYTKWFDMCKDHIIYKYIEVDKEFENYSVGELTKLKQYNAISDMIIKDIKDNLVEGLPIKIAIEGYSYASSAGDIIDLVTFSTLVRSKLLKISEDIIVLSPATLKLESCKLTYPPVNVGKKKEKWEYRNHLGIAGGSFSKFDMYDAIIDNPEFTDPYCVFLKTIKDEVNKSSNIKKPIEDTNDAYLLYLYLKEKCKED